MGEDHDSWLQGIGVDVEGVLDSVKADVQDAGSTVSDAASTIGSDVQDAGNSITSAATKVSQDAQDAAGAVRDAKASVDQGTDDLGGAVGKAATRVIRDAQDADAAVEGAVKKVKDDEADIKSTLDDANQQLVEDKNDAEDSILQGRVAILADTGKAVLHTAERVARYQPPSKTASGGGDDGNTDSEANVLNTAFNVSVDVTVEADGTWSYTWTWSYRGTKRLAAVHEEILITTEKGLIVDGTIEEEHTLEPGQTCAGGGYGKKKLPSGNLSWRLNIPFGSGYIGIASGSFYALVPSPD
jgi:hypothetical protein